jgi:hypothetical protein
LEKKKGHEICPWTKIEHVRSTNDPSGCLKKNKVAGWQFELFFLPLETSAIFVGWAAKTLGA